MKEIIKEQLSHIQKLEDRALLKELLNDVFMGLYEKNEEMYEQLEQRIFDEIEYDAHSYSIQTGVVEHKEYDPTHYFLTPILEEDVKETVYDLDEILEAMNHNKPYFILKAFFKVDYLVLKELLLAKQQFRGVIKTDKRDYEAYFNIEMNTAYQDKIHELYKIFIKNNIPWKTVNAPYISKIVDVYLIHCASKIGAGEEIQEINIDFGQYAKDVVYDLIPVWNVKALELTSTGFPMPCEDHINYEHIISIKDYGIDNGYLVQDESHLLQYVKHNRESLTVVSQMSEAQKWQVYVVVKQRENERDTYKYALMANVQKRSFTEKLHTHTGAVIKTEAELIRRIASYGFEPYLSFKTFRIVDCSQDTSAETYNMNAFIIDEIRDSQYQKKLILYFTAMQQHLFIIRDLLSFITSEIQLLYPEYQCEGKLV